jgi:UPF0755 protein
LEIVRASSFVKVKSEIFKYHFSRLFLFSICVLALFCSLLVYLLLPGPLVEDTVVIIEPKTSIRKITAELYQQKIISNPIIFNCVLIVYNVVKSSLKSGEYQFTKNISPIQVIRILASGKSLVRKFVIPEGETVHSIVLRLKSDDKLIGSIDESLTEGFLFPNTYHYSFRDQRSKLLIDMKRQMASALDELMPQLAEDSPLKSRLEVLTLASIVEKEALFDDEKPRIAGVFINRLKKNMKLQADPTTIYAITNGKEKLGRNLTKKDLKIHSEYNTYHVYGLPPAPIACPGLKSIEAVIRPVKSSELYFVVDGLGRHKFASNLEQHNINIAEYKNFRKNAILTNN